MADSDIMSIIQNLEGAAKIVLNPNHITHDQRLAAENYFLALRKQKCPYSLCRNVLENSSNNFVRYQITCVIKEATMREWVLLDSSDIENLWKYLLDYVCLRPSLPSFVTGEILMTVSTIVKRGTFDGKSGETDKIFETAAKMIASNDINLLSLACQMLLSLCTEYCTSWRSAEIGIPWDFHVTKMVQKGVDFSTILTLSFLNHHSDQLVVSNTLLMKRFINLILLKNSDLKRILDLALQVLRCLLLSEHLSSVFSTKDCVVLTNRILNVAETVLNWNFGSKYLPKRLTYNVEFSPAVTLHPPETWRPVVLNPEVLQIFFRVRLHAKVRSHNELAHQSLQCLAQLASLSGSIFPDERSRDEYFQFFIVNFMDLFQDVPSTNEVVNFALVVQKLFTSQSFFEIQRRFPALLANFLTLITRITCTFCCRSSIESSKQADENVYPEAYCKLLDAWSVLLKAVSCTSEEDIYFKSAIEIFNCFWRCHLSSPTGTRFEMSVNETDETVDDTDEDRCKYFDSLANIGVIGRCVMEQSLPQLANFLNEKITTFQLMSQQIPNIADVSIYSLTLQNIQEDLHWLLLIAGFVLSSEDIENIYLVPLDILRYSKNLFNEKKTDASATKSYLTNCLTSAGCASDLTLVDPIMIVIGTIFRWASVEHSLLLGNHLNLLSPQVAQTTAWCLRRIVCSYGDSDEGMSTASPGVARTVLQCGSDISSVLTHFLLEKFFGIMIHWSGEIQLTKEIVSLLVCYVDLENRADEVARDSCLISELGKIRIEQLSPATRKDLLKALVKIGASTDSPEVHQRMYGTILDPLHNRYETILKSGNFGSQLNSTVCSELLDLLDCFCGIADAVQPHSAKVLFGYLCPILESCSGLLATFKNNQTIIDAVLQLYVDISQKMVMYLKDDVDSEKLYHFLLTMLKTYSANNIVKYVTVVDVEEEKASDLLLVLNILTNLLSKDVFIAVGFENSPSTISAATVTLLGLEILMPLMNQELLKYPTVCVQYFKLITFASELYAEKMCNMPNHMKRNVLESIKLGLSFDFGIEVVKLSLDLLNAIATFVCQQQPEAATAIEMRANLAFFLRPVFETCLKASSDVELLNDSSVTLFSIICCDQAGYRNFVQTLIASHEDFVVKEKLTRAFESLLPSDLNLKQQVLRKEKRSFRDRFEIFLNDIQGLLCMSVP